MNKIPAKFKRFKSTIHRHAGVIFFILSIIALISTAVIAGYFSNKIDIWSSDNLSLTHMWENPVEPDQLYGSPQHTFMFKWPLFILESHFGLTQSHHALIAIGLGVLMAIGFILITFFVTRRNKIISSIIITAFASSWILMKPDLFLINLSMPAMRNVEYVIFLGAILLLLNAYRRSKLHYIIPGILLISLFASDKIFIYYSIGASVLLLAISILTKNRTASRNITATLIVSIVSSAVALAMIWLVSKLGIVQISSASSAPFPLVASVEQAWDLTLDAIQSTITVFGAYLFNQPVGPKLLPKVINLLLAVSAISAIIIVIRRSIQSKHLKDRNTTPNLLFVQFIAMVSFIAYSIYIFSNHASGGTDVRYLHIILFTGLLCLGYLLSNAKPFTLPNRLPYMIAGLLITTFILSATAGYRQLSTSARAATVQSDRYNNVAQILKSHQINVLVGSYWSVHPIKHVSESRIKQDLAIAPIDGCNQSQGVFVDKRWYIANGNKSAIYLERDSLAADKFNGCLASDFDNIYGTNYTIVIVSQSENGIPTGILRIYDKDIRKNIR